MPSNPCLECVLKDKDKNNRHCMQCAKRTQYVQLLNQQLSFSVANHQESHLPFHAARLHQVSIF